MVPGGADHHDRRPGDLRRDPGGGLDPVSRHAHVEETDVGLLPLRGRQGALGVARLGAHLEAVAEGVADPQPGEGVVVGDQDAYRLTGIERAGRVGVELRHGAASGRAEGRTYIRPGQRSRAELPNSVVQARNGLLGRDAADVALLRERNRRRRLWRGGNGEPG